MYIIYCLHSKQNPLAFVVIQRTVGLISTVGRASDLQAEGGRFKSCMRHVLSSIVYFTFRTSTLREPPDLIKGT